MTTSDDHEPVADDTPDEGAENGTDVATSTPEEPESSRHWYVLKVQSNRERTIRDSLLKRIKLEGLEEYFGEIVIPTEKVAETRNGKKRVVNRKLFPGYMMIHMELNDDTWYLVRDTSGVGDFTGAAGKPIPMQESEIASMLGREETRDDEKAEVKVQINVATGDSVKINDGPLESFEGVVESIDEASGKIQVLVQILGQSTPVELEYWQVERI